MKNKKEANGTLLSRFISEKIQRYFEPSRQGTPKGTDIGFSGKKYGATLYSLTNVTQKEIASRLEVSHGLLRKWHTEDAFKKMIETHCRDFAEVFMQNIQDRINRRKTLNDVHLAQTLPDIASQDMPSLDYEEISDAGSYSNKAFSYIAKALFTETEKAIANNDTSLQLELYCMVDVLRFFCGYIKPKPLQGKEMLLSNILLKSIIESSVKILLKPNLDEDDKKELLITMKLVKRQLE